MKKLLSVFFLFLLLSNVFAVLENGQMKIFAVTTEGEAVSADLKIQVESGTGQIWTNIDPLIEITTQNSEKLALNVASNYFSETDKFDYKFDIDSDASSVGGPSAGAAMALLLISMLQDRQLASDVGITGTISDQGRIGPVGGVFAKSEEANKIGLKLFMIPKGEARQVIKTEGSVKTVNLVNYAEENWSMKVIEVSGIDEVLKYAFSEIAAIDVNSTEEENEFLSEPLPEAADLKIMKQLSKRMLDEAKILIEGEDSARKALSNTSLDDSTVFSLLTTLNSAEQSLIQGEQLYEKNYLYSAANNIFIAKVYASLVKDVAENPSILKEDSKVFTLKIDDLKKNIEGLKENLDASVPLDYLEWYIAAKQRLIWAELNIEKIESVSQIVLDTGARTQELDQMKKIEDYEFALAWFETSRELYNKTVSSDKRVKTDDAFKNFSDNYIIVSENSLEMLEETEKEDILRRLDSAKRAEDYSWYLVTVFDSASSYALIKASIESKELSLNQAYSLLETKINEIDANLSLKQSSEKSFVWTRLYLDHAKYFLASADFYKEQGYASTALDRVKSGLSLVYLSEELLTASDSIYSYYSSFSEKDFIDAEQTDKKQQPELLDLIFFASIFILLTLILVVSGFLILRETKKESLEGQITQLSKLKRKADDLFFNGEISEEKHNELNKEYSVQLNELRNKIRLTSSHLIEAEEKKEEAKARERTIRDLKKLRAKKLISLQEFNKKYDELLSEELELKQASENELLSLKKEKKDALKKSSLLKDKTKKLINTTASKNRNSKK